MEHRSWLQIQSGKSEGKRWQIPPGRSSIGRAMSSGLRLRGAGVSRTHVELRMSERHIEVRDRGSKNGVFLDAARLESGWHILSHGQRLEVGEVQLLFCSPDGLVEAALAGEGTNTRTLTRARLTERPYSSLGWPLGLAGVFFLLSWLFWR